MFVTPSFVGADDPVAADGPSPIIWGDCPWETLMLDPTKGVAFYENWFRAGDFATTKTSCGYMTMIDPSGSIEGIGSTLTTNTNAVIAPMRFYSDGDDNDQVSLGWPHGGVCCEFDENRGPLWFETIMRINTVADDNAMVFLGLCEEGCSADDTLVGDNDTDWGAKDFVGFTIQEDDGDSLDISYKISSGSTVAHEAGAQVVVASTWYKLGMKYNPNNYMLTFFIDGAQVGDALDTTLSTFPNGEELGVLLFMKLSGADGPAATNMDIGWWKFAQLYDKER